MRTQIHPVAIPIDAEKKEGRPKKKEKRSPLPKKAMAVALVGGIG